jgi:hypothetical protein
MSSDDGQIQSLRSHSNHGSRGSHSRHTSGKSHSSTRYSTRSARAAREYDVDCTARKQKVMLAYEQRGQQQKAFLSLLLRARREASGVSPQERALACDQYEQDKEAFDSRQEELRLEGVQASLLYEEDHQARLQKIEKKRAHFMQKEEAQRQEAYDECQKDNRLRYEASQMSDSILMSTDLHRAHLLKEENRQGRLLMPTFVPSPAAAVTFIEQFQVPAMILDVPAMPDTSHHQCAPLKQDLETLQPVLGSDLVCPDHSDEESGPTELANKVSMDSFSAKCNPVTTEQDSEVAHSVSFLTQGKHTKPVKQPPGDGSDNSGVRFAEKPEEGDKEQKCISCQDLETLQPVLGSDDKSYIHFEHEKHTKPVKEPPGDYDQSDLTCDDPSRFDRSSGAGPMTKPTTLVGKEFKFLLEFLQLCVRTSRGPLRDGVYCVDPADVKDDVSVKPRPKCLNYLDLQSLHHTLSGAILNPNLVFVDVSFDPATSDGTLSPTLSSDNKGGTFFRASGRDSRAYDVASLVKDGVPFKPRLDNDGVRVKPPDEPGEGEKEQKDMVRLNSFVCFTTDRSHNNLDMGEDSDEEREHLFLSFQESQ